jgi:hypothetical protein
MATTVTTSKRFSLNWQDIWKGLKMAVILPALTTIYTSLEAGKLDFDWKTIGMTAALGFIGYLIKNFISPPEIVIKDPSAAAIDAVNDGTAEAKVITK